jgi:hypothetical protein
MTLKNMADGAWKGGWWAEQTPSVEEIVRRGLLQTAQLVIDKKLPADCYWLCAGPDDGLFRIQVECFISWNARQVTLLILTPEHLFGQMHHAMDRGAPNRFADQMTAELGKGTGMIVVKPNAQGDMLVKPVSMAGRMGGMDAAAALSRTA